jgi:hypothetical protein
VICLPGRQTVCRYWSDVTYALQYVHIENSRVISLGKVRQRHTEPVARVDDSGPSCPIWISVPAETGRR